MRIAVITILLWANPAAIGLQDAATIEMVKRVNAVVLDPALPREPFEQWLRRIVAPAGEIEWEVNDCGEQTGDPSIDNRRDLPLCVEARASTWGRSARATVGVQVAVGSKRTGVRGTPRVRWIYIEEGSTLGEVPTLAGLSSAISALRDGPSPFYRAGLEAAVTACCPEVRLPGGRNMLVPWSLTSPNYSIEGDFDGDASVDVAVLLVDTGGAPGPTVAVFHHVEGRYQLAHRQRLDKVDDIVIARPQEIVLRLIKRGEEWAPEGGDVPQTYPHSFDAVEFSTQQSTVTGGIEARQHLLYWNGHRYELY